ncbi:hypothetical protein KO525_08765 [Psychrosphaera sp. B3R10]|uniref:hypothetical protein n=1 Tax=unclassified Psychrosphaera TaxID=2641570 RepID=UPI001C094ED7|nr:MULTISPECIES: hypothetical protein [unclassified Psychrosphaera]MBU2882516.1 hypothetical protein [Psychrosphaera sp. I2R16]MBU2989466.1 hypothetical protein [Psychrosphaera sp. B3R10]
MTTLTKLGLALALAVSGASFTTQANSDDTATEKKFNAKPFMVFGYAFGGDDMGTLEYEDGSSSDVSAGGGFTMGGGVDIAIDSESFGFSKPIGVKLSGAYKFDSATADNADITFDRFEFTVLPYVQLNEKVTLGAGVSFHTGVEFSLEMDGSGSESYEFDGATAFVAELGFKQNEQLSWGFRFTSVEYTLANYSGAEATSGSNFGGFMTYSFKQ